ncbi:MAG: hypothetical protein QM811_07060 [Pirellulales bacterium]
MSGLDGDAVKRIAETAYPDGDQAIAIVEMWYRTKLEAKLKAKNAG